ncbi:MAG: hypothetical protein HONBIEJF_01881 [Fimbriimonadaceae bacterium]|nr:hypothetical protein [Fimbriimonadaceae bacterium]
MPEVAEWSSKEKLSEAWSRYGATIYLAAANIAALAWFSIPLWPFFVPGLGLEPLLILYLVWNVVTGLMIYRFGVIQEDVRTRNLQAFLEPEAASFLLRFTGFILFAILAILLALGLVVHWLALGLLLGLAAWLAGLSSWLLVLGLPIVGLELWWIAHRRPRC